VAEIPHRAAEAEEAAGSHRPEAEVAAGSHRPEMEEEAGSHRPEVEEEADTHRVEAEAAGSYQGAVAVDRSWTPSSDEISWQRAC
jgi:hypothetical protein